jgi:threonyl-tRNA synthetase
MNRDSSAKNLANANDHREIGKKYELFSFHEEGPGFPFFLEKGLIIKDQLMQYWKAVHAKKGYSEIESPILLDRKLWEKSGHWDLFKDNMFQSQVEGRDYAIKPMSCPGAILVYKEKKRSFKELPLRLSELGHVHRNENSGSLHGLLRVRSFIQDDAHIFCEDGQLEGEIKSVLDLCKEILGRCGFDDYKFEVAVRDPKKMKYLGSDKGWDFAESCLVKVLKEFGYPFERKEGDAKFYGPSIDLHIKDSHGRYWQCSSIQLDFNLGSRFDVHYFDKDGNKKVPFILHRAIYGSLERFIGVLLENYGMDLPFWLVPEQFRVLSVDGDCSSYAKEVQEKILNQGLRGKVDLRDENLSIKVKKAQEEKIPFIFIIGKKEMNGGKVSMRQAKGKMKNLIELEDVFPLMV